MIDLDLNGKCPRCTADWRDLSRPIAEDARHLYNDYSHRSRVIALTDGPRPRFRCPDCRADFPSGSGG